MKIKKLSADGMINSLKNCFLNIPEHRNNLKNIDISIEDASLSAFAMFSLKYPSLLSFTKDGRNNETTEGKNLHSLFKIKIIPSPTQMRTILDNIETSNFRKSFLKLFSDAQRGGVLKKFEYLDGKYLAALDGTGAYSSNTVKCNCCMIKVHKKTKKKNEYKSYYHQTVGVSLIHPDTKQVIPFCPEPIQKQDGKTKNDCERNATKRVLRDLKKEHPRLPLIIVEDALSANAPHIKEIKSKDYSYILGVKPGDHKYLFDWINTLDNDDISSYSFFEIIGKRVKKKRTYNFKWYNGAPLNYDNSDLLINFLDFEEITETLDSEGNTIKATKKHFTWVTDINLTKNNIYKIMRGGRSRWRIENEVFNTLKNQGYNLSHNFGHGYKNLCNNFITMMFLAFLVDQLQELACSTFQKALKVEERKSYLWKEVMSFYKRIIVSSWNQLLNGIISPPVYIFDTT